MASDESSDLLMKFMQKGKPLTGYSTTKVVSSAGSSNELIKGFTADKVCCEVDKFSMHAGLKDESAQDEEDEQKNAKKNGQQKPKVKMRETFMGWRTKQAIAAYPVDMGEVTFSRQVDRTSIELVRSCVNRTPFNFISIIKRKASGITTSDNTVPSGEVFLRLDFFDSLLTGVDWSNDDRVSETYRFVCRAVKVRYRPQLPDGSLGAVIRGYYSFTGDPDPNPHGPE